MSPACRLQDKSAQSWYLSKAESNLDGCMAQRSLGAVAVAGSCAGTSNHLRGSLLRADQQPTDGDVNVTVSGQYVDYE